MIKVIQRANFSTYPTLAVKINSKDATTQQWVRRQLSDRFVKESKIHNFRCRSAFKLLQINEKYNLFKPGNIVIDCGAAPGSWSQVAVAKTNANNKDSDLPVGRVIGIDRITMSPLEGATFLCPCDFTTTDTQKKLHLELNGDKVDIVLSDMAPNATGLKKLDHQYLIEMAYKVLRFALLNSQIDGKLLIKLWRGDGIFAFENNLKRFYNYVKLVKPEASRTDSSEIYFLARDFKGVKQKEL